MRTKFVYSWLVTWEINFFYCSLQLSILLTTVYILILSYIDGMSRGFKGVISDEMNNLSCHSKLILRNKVLLQINGSILLNKLCLL